MTAGSSSNPLDIQIAAETPTLEIDFRRLEDVLRGVCGRFAVQRGRISAVVLDDARIAALNQQFLGHEGPTDVISFDLSEDGEECDFELVVNADEAARQAHTRGHSTEAELALYLVHGLLHNLGFDDADAKSSEKMHRMEDELLQEAGYGIIYRSRTE